MEKISYVMINYSVQRFQKSIYLYLFTDCFMKISFQLSGLTQN